MADTQWVKRKDQCTSIPKIIERLRDPSLPLSANKPLSLSGVFLFPPDLTYHNAVLHHPWTRCHPRLNDAADIEYPGRTEWLRG